MGEMDASCSGDKKYVRILVGKSKEKKLHVRPWRKWENNIKMYIMEMVYWDVQWVYLVSS